MNDLGVSLHSHNHEPTFLEAAKKLHAVNGKIEINRNYLEPGFLPGFGMMSWESPIVGINRTIPKLVSKEIEACLAVPDHEFFGTIQDYARMAVERLKTHLRQHWQSQRPTLILHSNGYDSRILSSCLAALRDEGFNLGQIHFRCHEPEGDSFKRIMERQGWKFNQYSIYKAPNTDVYNVGHWDLPGTSPWLPITTFANFWWDIVPPKEEKNWNLMCGVGGGEFCEYPALGKAPFVPWTYCANKPVQLWWSYFIDSTDWIADMEARFAKVLFPYFGALHIQTVAQLPNRFIGVEGNGCDRVRASMLRTFDDSLLDLPRVLRTYTWNVSWQRWADMKSHYATSIFRHEVKGAPEPNELIKRIQSTWFDQRDNTAERIWRLASLWEVIRKGA